MSQPLIVKEAALNFVNESLARKGTTPVLLVDALEAALQSGTPIVVVDAEGRIVGSVTGRDGLQFVVTSMRNAPPSE